MESFEEWFLSGSTVLLFSFRVAWVCISFANRLATSVCDSGSLATQESHSRANSEIWSYCCDKSCAPLCAMHFAKVTQTHILPAESKCSKPQSWKRKTMQYETGPRCANMSWPELYQYLNNNRMLCSRIKSYEEDKVLKPHTLSLQN